MTKYIELKPIRERPAEFEEIEERIKQFFKEEIYLPLIREIGLKRAVLKNANEHIIDALQTGRITYYRGVFSGPLNAQLSRELRKLGAVWDRARKAYVLPQSSLPMEVRQAISAAEYQLTKSLERIDKKIAEIVPAEIAGKLRVSDLIDKALHRVERDFESSVKAVSIPARFAPGDRERMAAEYTKNLQLYIQEFTEKETLELRKRIQNRTLEGIRYESIVKEIQDSYGVSKNKAKFLARQETMLATAKYAQLKYESAGITHYKWVCVHMPHQPSKNAPYVPGDVRYFHAQLDDTIQAWNNPPIVNSKGDRKHPKQDYNCRCMAIPLVQFNK